MKTLRKGSIYLIFLLPLWLFAELYDIRRLDFSFWSKNKTESDAAGLIGPGLLCNPFGNIVGKYNGGGNPSTDLYSWKIFDPTGTLLFSRGPGSFPIIDITFSQNGSYSIELEVTRAGNSIGQFKKPVEIIPLPKIQLKTDYLICPSQTQTLVALDPTTGNLSSYKFEWRDDLGNIIGTDNDIVVGKEGEYSVSFFLSNSAGEKACETELKTQIKTIPSFSIDASSSNLCPSESILFKTNPAFFGEWSIQKIGESSTKTLGLGSQIDVAANALNSGYGEYELFFKLENPENPSCTPVEKITFSFSPQPSFIFDDADAATDCFSNDGKLVLKAETNFDVVTVEGTSIALGPFEVGDLIEIPNLKPGTYNIIGTLASCTTTLGSVVPIVNLPAALEFEITDIIGESCTPSGKDKGSFKVKLKNGPNPSAYYRVFNERGGLVTSTILPNQNEFIVEINSGTYLFEVYTDTEDCILPWKSEVVIPGKEIASFEVTEKFNICQSFNFIPKTTQALEFELKRPDFSSEIKKAGEAFILDQAGEYELIGFFPGSSDICPTEKKFRVELVDPIDFEPELIDLDCIIGNRSYTANVFGKDPAGLLFFWRNDTGDLIGTGQKLFLPPTSFGEFSLEVQPANTEACPISPKKFQVKKPVLTVDVILESTKLCEFGPRAIIDLTTSSPGDVTDIEWRRYDNLGNIENLTLFKNLVQVIVDKEGVYEVSVFNKTPGIATPCELGRSTIKVDLIPQKVDFNIPGDLSICDPFELLPTSTASLEYTLTYPDGSVETKAAGNAFILDQDGPYTILGYDPNIKGPKCPEEKKFVVKINPPVQFQPILQNISCSGSYEYLAKVDNYAASGVDYFWKDQSGNLVGTNPVLITSNYGTFSLEVQPKGSISCQNSTVNFQIPVPVLSVNTSIIDSPLCPDKPNAVLKVETDFSEINTIEWWFTDFNNVKIPLLNENDKAEILAFDEGTYEVIVKNTYGCTLGSDQVLVLRSTDQVRPVVKENYLVCPRYGIGPTINPGNFVAYEWYFEGVLVSNNPVFKPIQVGNYDLFVESTEGCIYQTTFSTIEECELKLRLPDAIQPGNPNRQFLIYSNYMVDDLEIWIFNKWGNLVFNCRSTNLTDQGSTCGWDGSYNGSALPPGSYAYRINFLNVEKNIRKVQLGSVLVID